MQLPVFLAAAVTALFSPTVQQHQPTPAACQHLHGTSRSVCVKVHYSHPCLAHITDLEDPTWDPTVSYGFRHVGVTSLAYGLPQAQPGTKLGYYAYTNSGHRAGEPLPHGWQTNPWLQLSWMSNYAKGRYSSECGAWRSRHLYGQY